MSMTATVPTAVRPPFGARRLLGLPAPDLATTVRTLGPLPWQGGPVRLLRAVEASGLAGRGGAGFPSWRKLAEVSLGDRPVVVANGAEGEPTSDKDATLLRTSPHLVLDGLQLAAEAVGADRAYAYVRPAAVPVLRQAIAERAGLDRYAVTVVAKRGGFLAGEETAVVSALSGRAPRPTDRPPLVVHSGVRGRPTLVHNVETLAHLALLARFGSDWFRTQGTYDEPGTMLTTVSGAVDTPGVYEVPLGTPVRDVLATAGGPSARLGAVLLGGYHGAWVPGDALAAPLSRAGLAAYGATPGAGIVVALPAGECGLTATASIAEYLAGESAGQCGPCMFGLPALAEQLRALLSGRSTPPQVERLTRLVTGRGACHHPDGTARLVASALRTFADDVSAHLTGRCVSARGSDRTEARP